VDEKQILIDPNKNYLTALPQKALELHSANEHCILLIITGLFIPGLLNSTGIYTNNSEF
jgi:hypothetical protein